MSDRYRHLRANLELHREVTSARTHTWWCLECQLHQADDTGLCPMCGPQPGLLDGESAA